MEDLLLYFAFDDVNDLNVLLSVMMLSGVSAIVGSFTFLRKRALVGDAIAHSILPGVCLAFILTGTKHPMWLLIGAVVTGWLSLLAIDWITNKSRIKSDTAIGIVLTFFFGIGVLLLTSIQNSASGKQAGLDSFLFGETAWLTREDVYTFGGMSIILIIVITLFFKGFKLISFDLSYAKTLGLPVRFLEFLLATVTVLAVATGIKAVGVVLMAALLITPSAAAHFWTHNLKKMLLLAAAFGAFSGFVGAVISSVWSTPTAPWIVVALTLIAVVSVFFAPQRGLLARWVMQQGNRQKVLHENILKAMYKMGENDGNFQQQRGLQEIAQRRNFTLTELRKGLRRLVRKGLVAGIEDEYQLTWEGEESGRRVVKLHRLWEMYLNQRLGHLPDHIHPSAEAMEHIITPELEALLEKELEYPELDPHQRKIPYKRS